jgi:two-component system, NarL family, nitrate/nitrite response regulator NarL
MHKEPSPIRVFLVAPALVRWGLERLLSTAAPQIEVSGAAHSLIDAADEIESQFPDVVVVDGNDCTPADIRAVYERARVKILALASGGDAQAKDGAQAWLDTRETPGSFVRAIFNTAGRVESQLQTNTSGDGAGRTNAASPDVPARAAVLEKLTRKQYKVLQAIADNPADPAKVVADKLHMSEHTLRNHLTEIYAKLGVRGRGHLQALIATQATGFPEGLSARP